MVSISLLMPVMMYLNENTRQIDVCSKLFYSRSICGQLEFIPKSKLQKRYGYGDTIFRVLGIPGTSTVVTLLVLNTRSTDPLEASINAFMA
jgi:cyanate permease